MVQSVLALPEHLDVFEHGIARKLDFSFSGPQGARLAQLVADGRSRSARSTPTSNCSRAYFIDLTPHVALVAARQGRPARAISTPAPTPRTRRPSSRPPRSRAAS